MSEKPRPPQAVPINEFYNNQDRHNRRTFLRRALGLGAALLGLGGASKAGEALGGQAKRIINSPEDMRNRGYEDLQNTATGNSPSRLIPKVPPQK